jgi:hypothetical protein
LLVGCAASLVTGAGGYEPVLRIAISCAGLGALLPAFALGRDGIVARIIAASGFLPLLFIVGDFIRRYR